MRLFNFGNWFGGGAATFSWEVDGDMWRLTPSTITVERKVTGRWSVYCGGREIMPGNHNSAEWAKRDAWTFAHQNRRSLFGAYRIRLV